MVESPRLFFVVVCCFKTWLIPCLFYFFVYKFPEICYNRYMNNITFEFNTQLALDVLLNGLTEVTRDYVNKFNRYDLTEVVIPEGVKSINDEAFSWCCSLKSVTIPTRVPDLGRWVFWGCSYLSRLTFKGKTLDEVKAMTYYPWGIINPENISVQVS